MIKVAAVLAFIFCFSAQAYAQAKFEVFGGYSFEHAAPCGVSGSGCNFEGNEGPLTSHFNGWDAALTAYWKKSLGVTADFTGHYGSAKVTQFNSAPGSSVNFSSYSYLVGPAYAPHLNEVTPFVHGLIGAVSWSPNSQNQFTSLAWEFGGGVDVRASRRFAVRIAELDYLGDRARVSGGNANASSWLYSAGLVFAF